jgi:hypothetical protein
VTVFVISQLIQVGLALYAWKGLTTFPGITQPTINARNAAIVFGVIPCPGMGPVMQIGWIVFFTIRARFARGSHGKASAMLVTSFDPPGSTSGSRPVPGPVANPFAQSSPGAAAANPPAVPGGPSTGDPFAAAPTEPARRPADNPFD